MITFYIQVIEDGNANGLSNLLQMALWLPTSGKLYLPPAAPTPRVLSTDEYVKPLSVFFHASSERLLTVGHPYFPIYDTNDENKIVVPKVSPNQYRAFRIKLPDPNKFALVDQNLYDPNSERLVWRLRGIEVGRGGPIGVGSTGHPLFNKFGDTENPSVYAQAGTDERQNVSFDPKQNQMFILGCAPAIGQHWDKAKPCAEQEKGSCPPLQLVNSIIEDGDMSDIGLGNYNFKDLQEDHSGAPLDIVASVCKYPDYMKMSKDVFGDSAFFFGRREQMYVRHLFTRNGTMGDKIPDALQNKNGYYTNSDQNGDDPRKTLAPWAYFTTPSGSLVSSESQLFNRPYWLQRAQGTNNGILWGNQLFVTVLDNTHGTNMTISMHTSEDTTYKASEYKQYLRHTEEYEIDLIVQLCSISLTADVLSHLHVMNPSILENWNLAFVPPAPAGLEDTYRYLSSLATKCPDQAATTEKEDPYSKYSFWEVDLTEKMSTELTQYSLGRRFLFQTGLVNGNGSFKRVRSTSGTRGRTAKKRKTSKNSARN